jgi:hypothetical protein
MRDMDRISDDDIKKNIDHFSTGTWQRMDPYFANCLLSALTELREWRTAESKRVLKDYIPHPACQCVDK